jgi:hypothetical protein
MKNEIYIKQMQMWKLKHLNEFFKIKIYTFKYITNANPISNVYIIIYSILSFNKIIQIHKHMWKNMIELYIIATHNITLIISNFNRIHWKFWFKNM